MDYYTEASISSDIEVLGRARAAQPRAGSAKGHGQATVSSKATGYKKIKLYTHEMLGRGPIDLPELRMPTTAFWLAFPEQPSERLREVGRLAGRAADATMARTGRSSAGWRAPR